LIARTLRSKDNLAHREDVDTYVTHALCAEGFDASEDGTGRGTPLVPVAYGGNNTAGPIDIATAVNAHGGTHGRLDFESETFVAQTSSHANGGVMPAVAMNLRGREGGAMPELADVASLRSASGGSSRSYAFAENSCAELRLEGGDGQTTSALKTGGGKPGQSYPAMVQGMQVRRLTPRECERLQGFPDDFTRIRLNKAQRKAVDADMAEYYRRTHQEWVLSDEDLRHLAADGPRYRSLGNSMAVPCLKWLLTRIEQHHQFRAEADHAA
jgi:DNA (cytosine-5)-methyltransferase 1